MAAERGKTTAEKRGKISRPPSCTKEPGGRTVQELDLTLVQRNQEEEQYRS